MHPLEAKVAALEGRQPVLDCNIAEPLERTWKILEAFGFEVTRQSERPARFHGDAGGRESLLESFPLTSRGPPQRPDGDAHVQVAQDFRGLGKHGTFPYNLRDEFVDFGRKGKDKEGKGKGKGNAAFSSQDELQSRVGEVSNRLEEADWSEIGDDLQGPSPADTVSRGELVELAKVLKQEPHKTDRNTMK